MSIDNQVILSQEQEELFTYLLAQEQFFESEKASELLIVPRPAQLPLSLFQEQLWFIEELHPGSSLYLVPFTLHFQGRIDVAALEQTLQQLVNRHEILRTTCIVCDGIPLQAIAAEPVLTLPMLDLSSLSLDEYEQETTRWLNTEALRPFDMQYDLLLRFFILRKAPDQHTLFCTLHHMIYDGWSHRILMRELALLYNALVTGEPSSLSSPPLHYADYAIWQRTWLKSEEYLSHLEYWKQTLSGATLLNLPCDYMPPQVATFHGSHYEIVHDISIMERFRYLGQKYQSTPFMAFLSAFAVLLSRYSGQDDLVIGCPVANRERTEFEGLIGYLANILALRFSLTRAMTFIDMLLQTREICLQGLSHQEVPFENVVKACQPERVSNRNPLFQVMFSYSQMYIPELSGLQVSFTRIENATSKFDLSFDMVETEDGLKTIIEYSEDLFDVTTIQQLAGHWQNLLEAALDNPTHPVSELSFLSQSELNQVLYQWNETKQTYPQICVHQLFEMQADRTPDAEAVICEGKRWTYRHIDTWANHLAHRLQQYNVGPDTRVGIYLERSVLLVVSMLAVLKAGGAYIPLDPDYPIQRIQFMAQDAGIVVLLTQTTLQSPFAQPDIPVIQIAEEEIATLAPVAPAVSVSAQHLALVIYTSGSTGIPKGTMITHANLVNYHFFCAERYQLRDVVIAHLQMASFSFDVFIADVLRSLLHGARLVICPREILLAPEQLYSLMLSEQITSAEFVPAVLRLLADYLEKTGQSLAFMRFLAAGADSWNIKDYEQVQRLCGAQTCLLNVYGLTEATIDNTHYESQEKCTSISGVVPIGRPIANTQVYILDPFLQPVPTGVAGELYIGGSGVGRGYMGRPDLTAERFIPDPFSLRDGSRLYRSGDLVRYKRDGTVEFLGRADHQIKIRGFRIELGEIEAVLREHPLVQEALVMAPTRDTGNRQIFAYITKNAQYDEIEKNDAYALLTEKKDCRLPDLLRKHLRECLPHYMVPSNIFLLEAFPLTPNGKLDRLALAKLSSSSIATDNDLYVAPQTPMEIVLTNIWRETLDTKHISIHSNFFEVGGHSLLATQVVSRIRSLLHIEVPIRTLFESPTIEQLARSVEQLRLGGDIQSFPTLVHASHAEHPPLSFAQQRLWFLEQLMPGISLFAIPLAFCIDGPLQLQYLEQAFREIVQRHEALRTTFSSGSDGIPFQVIQARQNMTFSVEDCQQTYLVGGEQVVLKALNAEVQCPFALEDGPLLRVNVYKIASDRHILLITMHHIIVDSWSIGILLQELGSLYHALVKEKPSPFLPLSIQYADFALWQQQWLHGQILQKQLAWWLGQLAGYSQLILPTDYPRPLSQNYEGAFYTFHFPVQLMSALKELGQQEGATLFMILLAAFQLLLGYYSQQDDVVVGTDIANRNFAEVENLIGFFINQLVLRTDLSGNPPFRELVKRVRNMTLQAYTHQDLPFEKLVEVLNPARDMQQHPIFQVKIVLQNASEESLALPDLKVVPIMLDIVHAKLDLVLLVREKDDGLQASFVYSTELFGASRIRRYAEHLRLVLENVISQPDIRLNELKFMIKKEQEQEKMQKGTSFHKYKASMPKPVSVTVEHLVRVEYLEPTSVLPLVLRPRSDDVDLIEWTKGNVAFLAVELLKHGAILFRGFNITAPAEFERFAATICPDLFGENSEHPRDEISEYVYTPVFYPPEKKLLWHNENSFNASWPQNIWFFCGKPASQGGETPLADSRKVFQHLEPATRERFINKNIMYVRNYGHGLGLDWSTVFRTKDKSIVEAYCREASIEFEWKDGDHLRTRQIRPAVLQHPQTEEWVWWNQATHWHPACLEPEVRSALANLFVEADFPRHCYYADGSPIADEDMQAICAAYQDAEVSFPWQQGDILMLDNMLVAHARNPFQGQRKLYVSMGNMLSLSNFIK